MVIFTSLSVLLFLMGMLVISRKRRYRKVPTMLFMAVAFLCLTVLSGGRGLNIGNDTPMYVRYFTHVSGLRDLSVNNTRFEFLFRLFVCTTAQFFDSPHALLIASAVVTLALFFRLFYKHSAAPWYSVLLFLFLMFYYSSMCLLRQYIAVALTTAAMTYLPERKWWRFTALVIAAGLFHTSALVVLVMLPLMIFPLNRQKRWWYIVAATIVALLFGIFIQILVRLMPRYANYLNSETYYLQNKLGTVIKIVLWAVLFFFVDSVYARFDDRSGKFKMEYFCALLGFSVNLAALQGAILSRMATYFVIMFCISVPNALARLPRRKLKYLAAATILAGCFGYNMMIFLFRPYWSGVLPYTFWG